jgi:hypothetical protein
MVALVINAQGKTFVIEGSPYQEITAEGIKINIPVFGLLNFNGAVNMYEVRKIKPYPQCLNQTIGSVYRTVACFK